MKGIFVIEGQIIFGHLKLTLAGVVLCIYYIMCTFIIIIINTLLLFSNYDK
jgi:hypothetical protein